MNKSSNHKLLSVTELLVIERGFLFREQGDANMQNYNNNNNNKINSAALCWLGGEK